MFNDYVEDTTLDLNALMIDHPAATFFVRMSGDSMRGAGIFADDLLVVDRSLDPKKDDIILAVTDGEFTVIKLTGKEKELQVWGVITYVIHKTR
ncbi:MAG TPA: S24 family peptidase [Rhabdochlamydiaceae bacterium]|nr:S24 family peptidase [Rhabdochlamydiaceae bacterium]